jgi:hypothetical protein
MAGAMIRWLEIELELGRAQLLVRSDVRELASRPPLVFARCGFRSNC